MSTTPGHHELSEDQKALFTEANDLEKQVLAFVAKIGPAADPRSAATGKTHAETGFMWLRRGLSMGGPKPAA